MVLLKILLENLRINHTIQICFLPILLKLFFDKLVEISTINDKNILTIGSKDFKRRLTFLKESYFTSMGSL